MFRSPVQHATLGGRKDCCWDRSFTVRKAPPFHNVFDRRLFEDADNRDTQRLVQSFLDSQDALAPQGPSHVFLREFLLLAGSYDVLTSSAPQRFQTPNLAFFDDRREGDIPQGVQRDWNDPMYLSGPAGVNVDTGAVNERSLHQRLSQKVCMPSAESHYRQLTR